MKSVHKLLAGIALLGFAGLLAAAIGTGEAEDRINAFFENKTKNTIYLRFTPAPPRKPSKQEPSNQKKLVAIAPFGSDFLSISSENPTFYVEYLGQKGFINIYRHISTLVKKDGMSINIQHPKLDAYIENIESGQPIIAIIEK